MLFRSTGTPSIAANSEPRLGNAAFAITGTSAPSLGFGWVVLGFGQASVPVAGVQVQVDPNLGPTTVFVGADARGACAQPLPLPASASWAGVSLYSQFLWLDACNPQGLSASAGLRITLRPQ